MLSYTSWLSSNQGCPGCPQPNGHHVPGNVQPVLSLMAIMSLWMSTMSWGIFCMYLGCPPCTHGCLACPKPHGHHVPRDVKHLLSLIVIISPNMFSMFSASWPSSPWDVKHFPSLMAIMSPGDLHNVLSLVAEIFLGMSCMSSAL